MKKTILSILSFCLFLSMGFSQKEFSEGYIKMEITDVITDSQEAAQFVEMMKGTETEIIFNQEQSISNVNMMGGMMEMKIVINNEDQHMNMFFNAMGNKMQIESTKEERDKMQEEQGQAVDPDSFILEWDENVTKDILGHECTKLTVKSKEDPEADGMVLFVAKNIKASNKLIQGMEHFDIQGFPLEYQINAQGMKMVTTAVELKHEVPKGAFDINTNGYQKMTLEEFTKQMGAMGGGFGG